MNPSSNHQPAGTAELCGPTHFSRRSLLGAAAAGGVSWLTPLGERLARGRQREEASRPQSVIMLWMQGGPSQLETFDPHPGGAYGGSTQVRRTNVAGVRIASGLERVADVMDRIALIRSVVSQEGDHERATYNVKTGFNPVPTLIHPSIGSVICHQLKDNVEIPRHVSILPNQWPARGGYLGDQFDAFKIGDPRKPVPDVKARVSESRQSRRVSDLLDVIEPEFAAGRLPQLDQRKTLHQSSIAAARKMMSSAQLQAFDLQDAPAELLADYGDTPFGRGCLAATQLIEAGVRCVEVTLSGWDSHINNHETQASRVATLDPAFAALVRDLERRKLLDRTLVVWAGEFGRTPRINAAGGRDHWPHGFTIAMAGGNIRGGTVVGETAPEPLLDVKDKTINVKQPRPVRDVHATILAALGIRRDQMLETPVGRPMDITLGEPIETLLLS